MDKLMANFCSEWDISIFNIQYPLFKGSSCQYFLNLMISSFLYPMITILTRVTRTIQLLELSLTLIDNILMDGKLLKCSFADALITDGLYHFLLMSKLKNSGGMITMKDCLNKKFFRDFRKDNKKKDLREKCII